MIKIVEESGFCHGVRAAVHKADELIKVREGRVFLYGDLLNNRHVMSRFLREGVTVTESAADVTEGDVVLIRAHGVSRDVCNELAAKGAKIVDCTCVKVKSIHKIVAEKSVAGFCIVIIGKKNHPEVLGILGWCEGGVVAENEAELKAAISVSTPICVVAQTTCSRNWWERASNFVKANVPNAEIHNTICDVTARRISNAVQTAKESDCMVVVGDQKSANSVELYEACKAECVNTFFVSATNELAENANKIAQYKNIGIAGSASTPTEIIKEIGEFLLFGKFLLIAKSEIESACDKYLANLSSTKNNRLILDAINDLKNQNINGKRIRGTLIKLGAEIAAPLPNERDKGIDGSPCGGKASEVLAVSIAYEIFATAILIHDDVIDKSETRRGKRTIHTSEKDAHFGLSRAICIGDYGLFLANKILAESGLEPEILQKVLRLFSDIQLRTLEGELMDVSLPYFPMNPSAEYEKFTRAVRDIYEYKTAWYTLIGPLQLGAICGGAGDEMLKTLHEIALPLGLAFQIKDDLLGIFASEKTLGKPALSDVIEKKQTTLYGFACKHATPAQRDTLEKIYGNPSATAKDLETVRDIFTKTGARAQAEAEIATLSQNALIVAEKLQEAHKPIIRGLAHYLTARRF